MNRRKFIGTCCCCAFASMGATLLNKKYTNTNADKYCLNNFLEVHLAEHCNLNCKYCRHYACIAQEEFYDLDKFKQDIKRLSFIFDKKLFGINLMGGEPLLNPRINEYIKITRKYFPKAGINITTNATLLDSMDKSFWETLYENKVDLVPSVYPVKINWKSILDKAKKYNVEIYGNHKDQERLTIDNIEKFRINSFIRIILDENSQNNVDESGCRLNLKKILNMQDGKLYPCPTVAYIRHLNNKFGTKFIVAKDDYLDIYKIKNTNQINEFISKQQIPFCNYCKKTITEVKWENSKEHNLNEWT